MSKAVAAKKMKNASKEFDRIKMNIEFKVANRPLLVEQVSKAFIHNLNQIKELNTSLHCSARLAITQTNISLTSSVSF